LERIYEVTLWENRCHRSLLRGRSMFGNR